MSKKNYFMTLKRLTKIRGTVIYRGIIAAIDQGFLSLINFGVQILLIKNVTKNEFGYYSLGLSIIMYMMSFQNAVVNTPITVTLAEKTKEEKNSYLSAIFTGQFYVLLIICSLGATLSLLINSLGIFPYYGLFAMSLFIGGFGVLNREFLRSYFFAEEKPEKVLKLDIYYGLIYMSLVAIALFFYSLSVPLIITFMGLASIFDSLILNKHFNYKSEKNEIINHYKSNWKISKWSLIGITVTHLQNFTYLYVIGIILGAAAMGEISASRLLLMPLGLIINGWGNVVRPYGAKLREKGLLKKFFKSLIVASLVFPVIVLSLTGLFFIFSDLIIKYVFTSNYKSIFDYLLFWAILSCVSFFQANASYGLQVIKKFKSLALFNAITMFITLLTSIFLTQILGIKGALLANLIGSSIFASILWYILFKSIYIKKYE